MQVNGFTILSIEDLIEVFKSSNSENLFVGISVRKSKEFIILLRGKKFKQMTIPSSWFSRYKNSNSPNPDFDDFEIIDYGHTIRLGKYEAATEAVLYDFDPEYKKAYDDARAEC